MATTVKYAPFNAVYLFGGTRLMSRVAEALSKTYIVRMFTAPRQAADVDVVPGVEITVIEDINVLDWGIVGGVLGIGIGEAWQFGPAMRVAFGDNLVDFMSIPYPHYLGGAHLTHAVMRGETMWGCCMQLVTENTKPGVIHDGDVIFAQSCPLRRGTLKQVIDALDDEYLYVIHDFVTRAAGGHAFEAGVIGSDEAPSFFPRLSTEKQAWIDWRWSRDDIVRFIRAFDAPYPGARTTCGHCRVTLHDVNDAFRSQTFHPFQLGLVIGVGQDDTAEIACRTGTIMVKVRFAGSSVKLRPGMRLYTSAGQLEAAMIYTPNYDANGDANAR